MTFRERIPSLKKPLPAGTRIGLLAMALTVLLVACQERSAALLPVGPAGGPKVTAVTPVGFVLGMVSC